MNAMTKSPVTPVPTPAEFAEMIAAKYGQKSGLLDGENTRQAEKLVRLALIGLIGQDDPLSKLLTAYSAAQHYALIGARYDEDVHLACDNAVEACEEMVTFIQNSLRPGGQH